MVPGTITFAQRRRKPQTWASGPRLFAQNKGLTPRLPAVNHGVGLGQARVPSFLSDLSDFAPPPVHRVHPTLEEESEMKPTKSSLMRILSLAIALAVFATACGDSGDVADPVDETTSSSSEDSGSDEGAMADEEAMADAEGEVFISGSSTVAPISVRVAELFEDVAPGVRVDVEGPGTGDGFQKFCRGETDISDALSLIHI